MSLGVLRCLSVADVLVCGLQSSLGGDCGVVLVAGPFPAVDGIWGNSAFSGLSSLAGCWSWMRIFLPLTDKKQAEKGSQS